MSVIGLNEAEREDVDLGRWGLSQRRTLDPTFFENIYRWSRNDGCRKLIPVFDYPQHGVVLSSSDGSYIGVSGRGALLNAV